jgi:4-hydroxy-2-oxoglutarate aldolase
MLLEGLHIPLTTPFRRDGSLDSHALAANVLRYSHTPAAGLIVLGPAGEPTLLNDTETRDTLQTVAQAAAPEKVLIAGIFRDSITSVLDLAGFAAVQQYDAILVGTPGVLASTQTLELLTYFRTLADRSPLPLILLSTSVRPIAVDAIQQFAGHPNIVGLLTTHPVNADTVLSSTSASARNVTVTHLFAAVTQRMQRASASSLISPASLTTAVAEPSPAQPPLRTRTKSVGFQIIAAHAPSLLDTLNTGAVGIAPGFAAAAPQACYEIHAAWKDAVLNHESDQPLASEKQQRIIEATQLIETLGPGALKFAADLNGYAGGFPRLPHLPPTGEQRSALQQLMKPLHN